MALPRIECVNFGKSIGELAHQWLGKILFATQKASQILLEYGYLLHRQLTFPLGVRPRHEVALRLAFSHIF